MPFRSMKMYFFIFGFQRRVWWPKWTPASSRSFMRMSLIRLLLRLFLRPAGRRAARRRRACGAGGAQRLRGFLPLRELEALAGARLSVLLALLHAGVAGQHAFLAQHAAQRLVEAHERPGDAEADRAGLAGQPAAVRRGVHVVAADRVGERERL